MEVEVHDKDSVGDHQNSSLLLELSATNDLISFKNAVEKEGYDMNEARLWYGRKVGSKKMGFEERTPLMVASMFGSKEILNYILQTGCVDVNRASGSDGATALHCAAAGGSLYSHEVIKLLVESSADVNQVDANGNRPCDVIAPCFGFSSKLKRRTLDVLLNKGDHGEERCDQTEEGQQQQQLEGLSPKSSSDGNGLERKEYPIDPSLPDIKNGIYGTDEFRMYTFKVKPCSRAYSHDWTECPFVHPGENARRRDPRKYHYSCVPCPEFRKGSCPKGDTCEYAHGIFECWLHPAQYRTRLCKDETNCTRRVCFFAHKPEELRPLYASTGSAVPSPRSYSSSGPSFDMGSLSPLSPSMLMPSSSTPPMTPTGATSPISGAAAWQNHLNITPPPALQLPGSRLKAALSARDMDFEAEVRRQQLLEELAGLSLSSPSSWNGDLGRLGGGMQMRQNMNQHQQLLSSYSSNMPSSPVRGSSFGIEPNSSPVSNQRLAAFAKRSHSFIDRNAGNQISVSSAGMTRTHLSDWGSPDGKVDWGVQGDELNKLRKSASFATRNNGGYTESMRNAVDEPDIAWVHSLVKDAPTKTNQLDFEEQYHLNRGVIERIPPWAEQLYMEQEPMAA
ncbi:Zinc finger CCCH domain-containing protein 66 [Bienertia sinuspersici]